MAPPDDGLLVTMLGQVTGRLDRIETRLDHVAADIVAIRQAQAQCEERMRLGAETFAAHDRRITTLESIAEQAREYCAIRRNAMTRSGIRWRKLGIMATVVGVAGTWTMLLGRALGWW